MNQESFKVRFEKMSKLRDKLDSQFEDALDGRSDDPELTYRDCLSPSERHYISSANYRVIEFMDFIEHQGTDEKLINEESMDQFYTIMECTRMIHAVRSIRRFLSPTDHEGSITWVSSNNFTIFRKRYSENFSELMDSEKGLDVSLGLVLNLLMLQWQFASQHFMHTAI